MRRAFTFLPAVAAVLLLAGCGKNENSMTGPTTGERALSGKVVTVGDLEGASPAGITVTAAAQMTVTGAAGRTTLADRTTVTDAAGRFSFTGLSSGNVELAFSRGDGVQARVTVAAALATIVVALQKTQATLGNGSTTRELEGPVTAITATSISLNDASSGPQTVAITSMTILRKGNTALTPSDFKVGDRVHVKATVGADGSLTAFEVKLQEGGTTGPGQTKELEGPITAVSDAAVTVMNASTAREETAAINAATVIRKGNTSLTAKDLHVGDRVHVKTTADAAGALTATEIMLQNPA